MKLFGAMVVILGILVGCNESARADDTSLAQINLAMAGMQREYTREHRRQQQAIYGTAVSFGADTGDCLQTSTRISHFNTVENDVLTPVYIKQEFHKDHPGACIGAWALIDAVQYWLTHRMDGSVQLLHPAAQAINLGSQAH